MTKPPSTQANTLYPGLPNYVGETEAFFTLLHHAECIVEYSWNVMERIECINTKKPEHERETRLRHIVYVPEELVPVKLREAGKAFIKAREAYIKTWDAYDKARDAYKAREACYRAREAYNKAAKAYDKVGESANKSKKLLAYLHKHVPDCKWNGTEIVFPSKP